MQILKTKLFIPAAQQSNVPRPRLVERLNGGLARKLTLLSAPAGFGKTTLLSDWARQAGRPVAWLSLAREDDDPIRFWSYFIAAVQTIHPGLCETVQAALQASQVPPLDAVATAVINELTGLSKPFILVLDDYHSIQSDAIHNSIDYLIDHLPAQLHLVIVTREDPPLSLSRRRGRAEVSELRAVELRFTIDEVSQFLNAVAGLGLTYEEIAALDDRTEGWAVGLQMAALSMRPLDLAGKHEFIVAFSGNDRYIVDYLVEEVLHRQPHQVQSFLLQTSILERMCGALCDAVTTGQGDEPRQQSGATATFSGGQEILEYLEHNNLFLVSLDTERRWYRYHHLFADLLKRRLLITSTPQAVRSLYCKASEWFEQAGLIDEAVAHAFASQDFAITASLIERNVLETFYRSETLLVHNWLKALPEEIINTRPLLCAVYASTHMLISTREENTADTWTLTETWLQRAETALLAHSESHPQGDPFDNLAVHYIDKVCAYLARIRGDDPESVIILTLHALNRLPAGELMFRCALLTNLAISHFALGKKEAAYQAFEQAIRAGEASNDLSNVSAAVLGQMRIAGESGRLRKAVEIYDQDMQLIARLSGGKPVPYTGTLQVLKSTLLMEWNQVEEAEKLLEQGLSRLELTMAQEVQQWGYYLMAQIRLVQGAVEQVFDWLDKAAQFSPKGAGQVATLRAKTWLKLASADPHYLDLAIQWKRDREQKSGLAEQGYDREQLVMGRVTLAQACRQPGSYLKELEAFEQFLEHQLKTARQGGWKNWELEVMILQALTWKCRGKIEQAITCLQAALELAEPEGYVRIFVDEGEAMQDLLQQAVRSGVCHEYASKLLAACQQPFPGKHLAGGESAGGEKQAAPGAKSPPSRQTLPEPLVEPLSAREIEILHLVSDGVTNPEIARQLCISINTVKTHITHIFGKLGASTRTHAVARARKLGLIP